MLLDLKISFEQSGSQSGYFFYPNSFSAMVVPASKFGLGGKEEARNFLGGQKCKKCAQSTQNLPFYAEIVKYKI